MVRGEGLEGCRVAGHGLSFATEFVRRQGPRFDLDGQLSGGLFCAVSRFASALQDCRDQRLPHLMGRGAWRSEACIGNRIR